MKHILKFLIVVIVISCQTEDNNDIVSNKRRSEVMVENNVFKISYNELKEPNWIEYTVKDFVKVADRGNMDFYLVKDVWTSSDSDYYNNPWDKSHMAPAGSFQILGQI